MNTDKLSKRLATVAEYVPNGSRVADIGSDHAYLPCYLVKNKEISIAIAGEVALGPFQSAERNVLAEGLTEVIKVRMGDGLEVLNPGEVDCITIAGMGGSLITSILDADKQKLVTVKRLVLQPNINAAAIRKWFLEHNWELVAEEILEEDGKIYEILVGEPGDSQKPYKEEQMEKALLFGPFLFMQKNDVFRKKWSMEKKNWQRIYQQLEVAAPTEETEEKKKELQMKIQMAEEVLRDEDSQRS